jgi:hypothetical protein
VPESSAPLPLSLPSDVKRGCVLIHPSTQEYDRKRKVDIIHSTTQLISGFFPTDDWPVAGSRRSYIYLRKLEPLEVPRLRGLPRVLGVIARLMNAM